MRALTMLAAGVLFGVGLGLSGMTRPAKVIGFLDIFGRWDPTLMFVMLGAMLVHFALVRVIRRRVRPVFDVKFHLPTSTSVDRKLVLGAAVFGAGWGLGGFCPGPAIVATGSGARTALAFVAAMVVGMVVQHFAHRPKRA